MANEIYLRKREERRLRAGHLWVFSNEVDTGRTPLTEFQPGDPVNVRASNGAVLGSGYLNPHALLCARLVSRHADAWPDPALLAQRLRRALALREALYDQPYYRLCFGESDGLPGLVVDRYGDVLVGQISTAGMERQREAVATALRDAVQPEVLFWQNTSGARVHERLETYAEAEFGSAPGNLSVVEQGLAFSAPLGTGQKTGWFYDQAQNRSRFARYLHGRVLDVCSYVGAWGVLAASRGAEATCLDSSALALEFAQRNAQANGCEITALKADAFDGLKSLRGDAAQFDAIVLDPPAFIKRRKDQRKGVEAYRRLNAQALKLLADDGTLISCSCSQAFDTDALIREIQRAARQSGRVVQVLETGTQGPDHPRHPAMAETAYLKAVVCRVGSRDDLP